MCCAYAGIDFSGIDSTFFKHVLFKVGSLFLLVTRDGNNQLLILALCICLGENKQNYRYFARRCGEAGVGKYLNRAVALMYADRHKAIPYFLDLFECGYAFCIVHIETNLRRYLRQRGYKEELRFHKNALFAIQKAPTRREYQKQLAILAVKYPHAAKWIDALPHDRVFTYALVEKGYANHGHGSNNVSEQQNSAIRHLRELSPYYFLNAIVEYIGQRVQKSQDIAVRLTEGIIASQFLTCSISP